MAFSVKIKAEEREGYGNSRKQKKDSMASGILFSSAIGLSGRDNLIGVSKGIYLKYKATSDGSVGDQEAGGIPA